MPCENYKDALIEAAVSGAEPQAELRAHLAACTACRTDFAEEQSLFASIDAGLRQFVSAEVPASLLPRVRARVAEEVVPHRTWFTNWLTVASAAAIIAVFFVVRVARHSNFSTNPPANSAKTDSPATVLPPSEGPARAPEPSSRTNSRSNSQTFVARNSQTPRLHPARSSIPEVLVPGDQEVWLARYAEQWRLDKHSSHLAQNSGETNLAPLEVAPIQIAELDVKLLADEKSQ
jgi:anti-sigma factor RsiW